MKHTDYTQPQLDGMLGTLTFGGVTLSPMDMGRCSGAYDLFGKYEADGQEGPGLFDEIDFDNREGRG